MVKLVRLTTDDETCVFKSNLDAGIAVSKDAKIALQNLTFENEYTALTIDDSNNRIISNFDTTIYDDIEFNIPNGVYSKSDYTKFFDSLQATLNCTLAITGLSGSTAGGAAYASYYIDYPNKTFNSNGDNIVLKYRYTPMTSPFTENNGDTRSDESILFQGSQNNTGIQVLTTNNILNRDNLSKEEIAPAGSSRNAYMFGKSDEVMMSRGSGIFCCRIENLGDAGASDDNGFGIGLSYTQVKDIAFDETEIPNTQRDFEIRVKKSSDNYFTITPTSPNTEVDSGVAPHSFVDASGIDNDLLMIRKNGNKILLNVMNSSVAGGVEAFTGIEYTIPDADIDKPLYPYIYICGAASDTAVGMPFITVDPNIEGNDEYEVIGESQAVRESPGAGVSSSNFFDILATPFDDVLPSIDNDVYDTVPNFTKKPKISMNSDIWHFLGFNQRRNKDQVSYRPLPLPIENYTVDGQLTGLNERMLRIELVADKDFSVVLSDNFVVILDNYSLFSYDASRTSYGMNSRNPSNIANRGRRSNILATIPVNNNNDGIVEYEPNTITYIDLDLSTAEEIKNLNLRVLNKDLSPIEINGKAVMTLLIQE